MERANMTYEFKNISTDNYELHYNAKDGSQKVIPFTRSISMATKLQGITAQARLKMFKELTAQGMTKDDLVVKHDMGNGKVTYDESNYQAFEMEYVREQSAIAIDEIIKECFKMDLMNLFSDMGVDVYATDQKTAKEVEIFTQKFSTIIAGKDNQTPSVGDKQQLSE
jgi:hypothetical protein